MNRLKRKMDGSDEGVATTVGTIMALLIFLSILSLITQQYVPVWMEDNEAYHMDEVKGQFAELKNGIDSLVINELTGYPLYSSVNLGTSGVPLFASSSPGRLTFSPRWGEEDNGGMFLSIKLAGEDEPVDLTNTGRISYQAINREFEDQTLTYEHGAIILEQSDGAIMRARPHISIDNVTGGYEVDITLIHLTGSSRDIAGTSRVGITTELVSTFNYAYSGDEIENLTWSLTTDYKDTWRNYFEEQVPDMAITEDNDDPNKVQISDDLLNNISELEITRVRVEVEISS